MPARRSPSPRPHLRLAPLALADALLTYAVVVQASTMQDSLGLTIGVLLLSRAVSSSLGVLAPLGFAALTRYVTSRPLLSATALTVAGVGAMSFTLAGTWVAVLASLLIIQTCQGSVLTLQIPVCFDAAEPGARLRALSTYIAFGRFGLGLTAAPLVVGLATGPLGLSWRGTYLLCGVACLLAATSCLGLREPGAGVVVSPDCREVAAVDDLSQAATRLGLFEIVRRLLLQETLRRTALALVLLGAAEFALLIAWQPFLLEGWGLNQRDRSIWTAVAGAASAAILLVWARGADTRWRGDATRVVTATRWCLLGSASLIVAAALAPSVAVAATLYCIAAAARVVAWPTLFMAAQATVRPELRVHAAGLCAAAITSGGTLGAFMAGLADQDFGAPGQLGAAATFAAMAGLVVRGAGRHLTPDVQALVDGLAEEADVVHTGRSGGPQPLLACRNVNFSYGQLQVLFNVDLRVDEGEMIALLGVNGAGKSTLLRAISGINFPSSGTIRFRGEDITFLDAERRLRLGISQIPGGRAVFGPVSVVDNLRAFAFSLGRDPRVLSTKLDEVFATFPRLAERRNSNAATLSGGEQQMLALGKAILLKPQVLLIDELSLGLAPVIVGELLQVVRRINAEGTAVILVEQSVNLALNLVDHAYFMEKGEIRFDGSAADLLDRGDLLRAVFLEGVEAST